MVSYIFSKSNISIQHSVFYYQTALQQCKIEKFKWTKTQEYNIDIVIDILYNVSANHLIIKYLIKYSNTRILWLKKSILLHLFAFNEVGSKSATESSSASCLTVLRIFFSSLRACLRNCFSVSLMTVMLWPSVLVLTPIPRFSSSSEHT